MEIVTILWTLGAAVAMTLAAVCGAVWVIERRNLANLMLCILSVATAGAAVAELGMMRSATVPEYIGWLRWYSGPVVVALVSQLLFVHYYLGTGRSWLMWTVIIARLVVAAANFFVYPNFNFSSIASLRHTPLFGEQVSAIGVAVTSEWQWFATASLILWAIYLIDAVVQEWLKGARAARRKAAAVTLCIIAPMMCTISYTQMLVFGFLTGPVSNIPWFLAGLVMMALELGRDFILSRRERLELAELRTQLAQEERVSLMGQLASTLAHELTQPLAASAANAEAALKKLEDEKPSLQELRAILGDIGRDNNRAAAIIARMRQLFRRRAIEMQPLKVEDVVQDMVSLVRAETASKHITVSVVLSPGLPRVLGDRVHLSQVLLNLLMNSIHAVQARQPDDRRIVVEAWAEDSKGEVEIAVRDFGDGIPDALADQVFKPFFTTKPEGMGMGLALSRTIIEAHGGRLWTERMPQQGGAVFRFRLRRAMSAEYSAETHHYPDSTLGKTRQAPA